MSAAPAIVWEPCPTCARLRYDSDCRTCAGEGQIQARDRGPDVWPDEAHECGECGRIEKLIDGWCGACWLELDQPWPEERIDDWF